MPSKGEDKSKKSSSSERIQTAEGWKRSMLKLKQAQEKPKTTRKKKKE